MAAQSWCEPCRAMMISAAETADPYDPDQLCASCREIIMRGLEEHRLKYPFLAPMEPVIGEVAIEAMKREPDPTEQAMIFFRALGMKVKRP